MAMIFPETCWDLSGELGVGKRSTRPSERATRCGGQADTSDSHLLQLSEGPALGGTPSPDSGFLSVCFTLWGLPCPRDPTTWWLQ